MRTDGVEGPTCVTDHLLLTREDSQGCRGQGPDGAGPCESERCPLGTTMQSTQLHIRQTTGSLTQRSALMDGAFNFRRLTIA
jgi:hypothetical protein